MDKSTSKTPAFIQPLYPFRAVGKPLSLEEIDCTQLVLYELKCPNPDCICAIHTRGQNVKKLDSKLREECGCPVCKLQFGENDVKGYQFKEGELRHELPVNNGRWSGFIIRRLIYVPKTIFQEYAVTMYSCNAEELTRQQADAIVEKFYENGKWEEEQGRLIALLKEKLKYPPK